VTPAPGKAVPGEHSSPAASEHLIARWLLNGPAQLRDGPHAGAVAGLIDEAGRAVYAYPEIAGYFLQWLAWRSTRDGVAPGLADRAAAVQRWLAQWLTCGSRPATRLHFVDAGPDWRNDALFFFDLAMVLRGLGAAARCGLIAADPAVVRGVVDQLDRLIAEDGLFAACRPHEGAAPPPDRWSTRRGPFLAKAAAGVLRAADALPAVPGSIRDAAEGTFRACLTWAVDSPHDEVHPMLYTYEGVLSLPQHPRFAATLPLLAGQFDALLAASHELLRVPETLASTARHVGPERIDIAAQTLRVGHLLAAHRPTQPPDMLELARVRQLVTRHLLPDGAIPFDATRHPAQRNVWATMFADQALDFASTGGGARALAAGDPLLV
jgi:hypothetical protein